MEKTNYNIATFKRNMGSGQTPELYSIPGYVFAFGELRFGVSNYFLNAGKPEKGFDWVVTELTSGYSVTTGKTRQAAIDRLLSDYRTIDRVKSAIRSFCKADANPGIVPATQFLTVHTR